MNIHERMKHDSTFNHAVRAIQSMISTETGLTPLDIRDAAFMARLEYERLNPTPIVHYPANRTLHSAYKYKGTN